VQDIEDDAMAGIKSSARALGAHLQRGVAVFYAAMLALLAVVLWQQRPDPLVFAALLPLAGHLGWQVHRAGARDAATALALFRANGRAGALVFAALCVATF
jgi:4-hydroxybenzoate polyprenyltransferase